MKWLQDNPLGKALIAVSGAFALISVALIVLWNWPMSVDVDATDAAGDDKPEPSIVAQQVGPLSEYKVINEKPMFNESRQPVISDMDDGSMMNASMGLEDAPEVKLTGVIITPSMRIASLQPVEGDGKSIMAHEGQPMTGAFVGWQVSSVMPRRVVLESREGDKLELELEVHDIKIEQPPKPAQTPAQARVNQNAGLVDEDGQPLSRAEQIRQRIAERREELRREQEDKQAEARSLRQSGGRPASSSTFGATTGHTATTDPNAYQNAIRAMMKTNRKDPIDNDDKDQGSKDKDG